MSRLSLGSLVVFAGLGCFAAACGSDDDSVSAGTAGMSAGGGGGKGGAATVAGAPGEGGAADSLYVRLGEYENIQKVVTDIVTAELGDEDIASFFAPSLKDASHTPQPGQIIECFSILLSTVAGGPYKYPVKLSDGYQCRSMVKAHEALHIGSGTFGNFITIAAGVLQDKGVAEADIKTIGEALTGTAADIVDPEAVKNGPCTAAACVVAAAGAAGDGGAAGGR